MFSIAVADNYPVQKQLPEITIPEITMESEEVLFEAISRGELVMYYNRFIRFHAAHFDTLQIPVNSPLRGKAWDIICQKIVEKYPDLKERVTPENRTGYVSRKSFF